MLFLSSATQLPLSIFKLFLSSTTRLSLYIMLFLSCVTQISLYIMLFLSSASQLPLYIMLFLSSVIQLPLYIMLFKSSATQLPLYNMMFLDWNIYLWLKSSTSQNPDSVLRDNASVYNDAQNRSTQYLLDNNVEAYRNTMLDSWTTNPPDMVREKRGIKTYLYIYLRLYFTKDCFFPIVLIWTRLSQMNLFF